MKTIVATIAGLTLLGGSSLATGQPEMSALHATPAGTTQAAFGEPSGVADGHRFGRGTGGREQGGGHGGSGQRQELRRRTMEALGIEPDEMLAARRAAIESMVEDGLVPAERAERMIERLDQATQCMDTAESPRECMRQQRGGPRRDGQEGGEVTFDELA